MGNLGCKGEIKGTFDVFIKKNKAPLWYLIQKYANLIQNSIKININQYAI